MGFLADGWLIVALCRVCDTLQTSAYVVQRHFVHLPQKIAADLGLELFEDVVVERWQVSRAVIGYGWLCPGRDVGLQSAYAPVRRLP